MIVVDLTEDSLGSIVRQHCALEVGNIGSEFWITKGVSLVFISVISL